MVEAMRQNVALVSFGILLLAMFARLERVTG